MVSTFCDNIKSNLLKIFLYTGVASLPNEEQELRKRESKMQMHIFTQPTSSYKIAPIDWDEVSLKPGDGSLEVGVSWSGVSSPCSSVQREQELPLYIVRSLGI